MDVKSLLDEARNRYRENDLNGALQFYEQAYYCAPHYQTALHYLAQIHRRRGDHDKADLMLKRSASLAPTVQTTLEMAQAALKKKDFDQAVNFAGMVAGQQSPHDKHFQEARTIMADACFKQGDIEAARKYYDEVLYYNPQHVRALTGRGSLSLTEQDFRAAHITFEKALLRNPHHSRAIIGKGLACLGLGRKAEAVELILEGLILEPDNDRALASILPLLMEAGRLAEADEILERYLNIYPDDSPMLLAHAGVLYTMQRFEECEQKLNYIRLLKPDLQGVDELSRELEGKRQYIPRPECMEVVAPVPV
jgi:pentatricopeptide repeat protein